MAAVQKQRQWQRAVPPSTWLREKESEQVAFKSQIARKSWRQCCFLIFSPRWCTTIFGISPEVFNFCDENSKFLNPHSQYVHLSIFSGENPARMQMPFSSKPTYRGIPPLRLTWKPKSLKPVKTI